MITNKDIRVENGNLVLNGDKFPLDGQSPETIMEIVEDNSDTTPTENSTAPITSGGVFAADKDITDTIGDITQSGVTGATVADQLGALDTKIGNKIKKLARQDLSYTCTSTNLEYTGLNVTCPASHAYIVRARLSFSSTAPSEILVSASSTSSSVYNRLAYGESGYATFLLLAGETAYVWGKWGATGENSASVEIIDITV